MLAATVPDTLPCDAFRGSALPPREAIAQWRQRMGDSYELEEPDPHEFARHGIEQRGYLFGGMALLHRRHGAHRVERTQRLLRSSRIDHYGLRMALSQDRPWQLAEENGRSIAVGANEPVFTDMTRHARLDFGAGEDLVVFVPRDALDALLPRRLDLHGVRPEGACTLLLAHHLRSLVGRASTMQAGEAPGVMTATLHLMAASLAPCANSLALARPEIESNLLRRICQYVEAHLADPALSAEQICADFHISRSTLYRLVEPLGGVAAHVRERRLARIHAMLANPAERKYLSRVADDFGFKSASHFSRAFRAQYGYSPREVGANAAVPAGTRGAAQASTFGGWLHALSA